MAPQRERDARASTHRKDRSPTAEQTSFFMASDATSEPHDDQSAEDDAEEGKMSRLRFEAELEFVQALANPEYLHHLAQNRYFDNPRFVEYVEYLQYWQELPYCLYIVFPQSLKVLELLQSDKFIAALKHADIKNEIAWQQHLHWMMRADVLRDEGRGQAHAGAST